MARVAAVTLDYPPRRWIGSELATHVMLSALSEAGHDVTVHCPTTSPDTWVHDGIPVVAGKTTTLAAVAEADLVVTHAELGRWLRRATGPRVAITHNARGDVAAALQEWDWDLVVHNANSTARDLAHARRSPYVVVHPPVDWRDWRTDRPTAEAITLVNVTGEKGADTFYALANRLPDRKFLGVLGGWGEPDIRDLPNVELLEHGTDMHEVYARTRVLLMPSEHESWGRVAVEAMSSGIPVLATDLPGPREAVGDGGVFIELDWVDQYERELRRLDDETVYEAMSAAAFRQAQRLDPRPELARLTESVAALLDGRAGPWHTDGTRTFRHRSGRELTVNANDPRCARYELLDVWEEVSH